MKRLTSNLKKALPFLLKQIIIPPNQQYHSQAQDIVDDHLQVWLLVKECCGCAEDCASIDKSRGHQMNIMLAPVHILAHVKLANAINVFFRTKSSSIAIERYEKDYWNYVDDS